MGDFNTEPNFYGGSLDEFVVTAQKPYQWTDSYGVKHSVVTDRSTKVSRQRNNYGGFNGFYFDNGDGMKYQPVAQNRRQYSKYLRRYQGDYIGGGSVNQTMNKAGQQLLPFYLSLANPLAFTTSMVGGFTVDEGARAAGYEDWGDFTDKKWGWNRTVGTMLNPGYALNPETPALVSAVGNKTAQVAESAAINAFRKAAQYPRVRAAMTPVVRGTLRGIGKAGRTFIPNYDQRVKAAAYNNIHPWGYHGHRQELKDAWKQFWNNRNLQPDEFPKWFTEEAKQTSRTMNDLDPGTFVLARDANYRRYLGYSDRELPDLGIKSTYEDIFYAPNGDGTYSYTPQRIFQFDRGLTYAKGQKPYNTWDLFAPFYQDGNTWQDGITTAHQGVNVQFNGNNAIVSDVWDINPLQRLGITTNDDIFQLLGVKTTPPKMRMTVPKESLNYE